MVKGDLTDFGLHEDVLFPLFFKHINLMVFKKKNVLCMYVVKHHSNASHPPTLFSTILQTPFPLYLTPLPYYVLDSSPAIFLPPSPPTIPTFSSPLLYLTFPYYILDSPPPPSPPPPPPPPSSLLPHAYLSQGRGERER